MSAYLALISEPARAKYNNWRAILEPLFSDPPANISAALREIAKRTGVSFKTVEAKYLKARKVGFDSLLDRRSAPALQNRKSIVCSAEDVNILRTYAERYQRNSKAAVRAMRRDWLEGRISTRTEIDPDTGFPRGWSPENLMRKLPSRFELKNARIGRSAAASERRLVYTSRRDLWVGSHYLFDDIWHDNFVNHLDQRKAGRPLEFHALDLYAAMKFAWGMRVRTESEAGVMKGLQEADMRFLLAHVLGGFGYSPRGTVLVVEHGTAAIRADLERLLYDASGGLITVARSGMEGAAAAAHQYAGRAKGNFRFKAALESLGNLIHNEMAALPGQTGKDIDHRPEGLHGLLRHNDALLCAIASLPPERIEMLRWPLLTIQQFRVIAEEIYARINSRTDHDLEGWDMHYVPDPRLGRMRRLAPVEVWRPGARDLVRLRPETIALILLRDNGVELTTRSGMFSLTDGEISGDLLRFDASALPDRKTFHCVLNPYAPSALYAFNPKGVFVGACPRIFSVCRGDVETLQRACGEAAKVEAARLLPFRARHLQEARDKAAMHRHNAAVVSGAPVTPEEKSRARIDARHEASAARFGSALRSTLSESDLDDSMTDPDAPEPEDWSTPSSQLPTSSSPFTPATPTPETETEIW